ncbi:MAG: hypothetical protein SOI56_01910 [Eubacteriales bacterium]|jgi:hypothetical protein
MKKFVNVYVHTPSLSEEVTKIWWRMKFRLFYILLAVMAVVVFAAVLITGQPLFLFYEAFPVLELIFISYRKKKVFKIEAEHEKEIYKDETPTVRVEIGDDIAAFTTRGADHVAFKDIRQIAESKDLVVMLSKNDVVITLKKDGFLEGTAEECVAYIRRQRRS